jgi:hypothetical protein
VSITVATGARANYAPLHSIENDGLLDILQHQNHEKYPNQKIFVVEYDDYVYLVPFVEESDYYFLKTVIPSRKATRDYLKKGD